MQFMRKISSALLFIIIINSGFSQTYKEQLKAVNDYLKTFDNGYYGYLEIKDGFLYDRFPSGKYSKSEIKYLGNAVALDNEYKVSIECTDSKDCVFSTYTDSYHKNISFSQTEYFDKEVLVGLLNNLLTAYKKNTGNYKNDIALIENKTSTSSNSDYQTALKKLNDYLKTFDNGYYGYLEIKDGYLYDRFKDGNNYCKAKISDIGKAYEKEPKRKVELYCKGTDNCLFSTFTNQNYNSFSFSQSTDFNTTELISLLDNLVAACKETNTKNKDGENNIDYAAEKRRQESLKSNTDNNGNNTTSTKNNSTGNYQSALKKLNDYLKTFDNGYYGYFEVINNEIFIRLKAGTYCSALISDLDKAYVVETNKKIEIRCLGGENCMNATYTSGKTTGLKMYQDKNFDTEEFIQLINDLISTLKKSNSNTTNSGDKSGITQSEISKPNTANSKNSTSGYSASTGNYEPALKKLNDYLKTFDNGYYGYFEVKDGYIYDRFKAGKYNKFKMEDIEGAVIQEQYSRVIFKCKGENKCISTDWKVNGTEDYTQFTQSGSYNYQELADLLNNFRDAYLGKKQTSTNNTTVSANKSREEKAKERQQPTSKTNDDDLDEDWDALEKAAAPLAQVLKESNKNTSSNYQPALKNLNEYLKTYNAETYKNVEVKDGKVYFGFFVYGANYKSSIDINELKNNTIITIGKSVGSSVVDEVKISCKGSSKCFYSTYSNGGADHFRFFSHSVKDFTKMEQLLKDFIKALN